MTTRKQSSFRELANTLETIRARQIPRLIRETLEEVGETCQHIAKEDIIGRVTPMQQVENYPGWAPLQDSTIAQKEREGLGKNGDPRSILYATGALYNSIEYHVSPGIRQVQVGTDIDYAGVHEYGSAHCPPRPFLGPAMVMTIRRLYPQMETRLCRTLDGSQTFFRR